MKLGLRDRAAAVVYAFDHGIVRPGDEDRLRSVAREIYRNNLRTP